jgi:hypothetical protein
VAKHAQKEVTKEAGHTANSQSIPQQGWSRLIMQDQIDPAGRDDHK